MGEVSSERIGIACAGNWIVDHVKIVDVWPNPGYLSVIYSEERGTGGAPFNVLVDLAKLYPKIPLDAIGMVGDDADGQWIMNLIRPYARDMSGLIVARGEHTSYTDVMTVRDTGQRTFFHMKGANARFDVDHVNVGAIQAKIFHLGYMFLLDSLDARDPDFGSRAACLLHKCRQAGLLTSIDMVSAEEGRYAEVVVPALRQTDYCIINELEAQAVTGIKARKGDNLPDWEAIGAAARKIAGLGVRLNVTVHFPEGGISLDVPSGQCRQIHSVKLPAGYIKGSAGAGDAFCSGMLLGLHEGWPLERSLEAAHAAAVMSLRHPTCTEGMGPLQEALDLTASFAAS
ncbi:carbohydrate kinase family protein [Candidatus Sumerlaeota bacterium]|nr:carbohydrate kinase family protein [Candidatus Sumerlaeota bacterium]